MKRLIALRGASRALNDGEDIRLQTLALYDELLRYNKLDEEDLVSVIFSLTRDLDAMNPAAALREEGRAGEAALFVVQEARIQGALERVIRILVHCYLEEESLPIHVYRNGAEVLRPDRNINDALC